MYILCRKRWFACDLVTSPLKMLQQPQRAKVSDYTTGLEGAVLNLTDGWQQQLKALPEVRNELHTLGHREKGESNCIELRWPCGVKNTTNLLQKWHLQSCLLLRVKSGQGLLAVNLSISPLTGSVLLPLKPLNKEDEWYQMPG